MVGRGGRGVCGWVGRAEGAWGVGEGGGGEGGGGGLRGRWLWVMAEVAMAVDDG